MDSSGLKILLRWASAIMVSMAFVAAVPSEARERNVRKKDVQKYVQEGEYDLNGIRSGGSKPSRRASKKKPAIAKRNQPSARHSKRSVASKRVAPARKKTFAKKGSSPKSRLEKSRRKFASVPKHKQSSASKKSTKSAKRSPKKPTKKLAKKIKTPPHYSRVPRVRATPNENDMPFVSVPNSRVRKDAKTIEMVDPAGTSGRDPEGPSQTALHPDRVSPPIAAPASAPSLPEAAATVPQTIPMESAANGPREPDAFDMHSGADPLHGNGPTPAEAPAATGL